MNQNGVIIISAKVLWTLTHDHKHVLHRYKNAVKLKHAFGHLAHPPKKLDCAQSFIFDKNHLYKQM